MAEEPENLVLQLLREIRAKLDEHDRQFVDVNARLNRGFSELNKKIDDWQETTATAVGLATHANLPHSELERQVADLAERVEALERERP